MKKYTITIDESDFEYEYYCLPEDTEIRGNAITSGDDAYDKKIEDEIINDLENGNEWAWCTVKVVARWRDQIEATEYLGGCSFKNEDDFLKYEFENMKIEAKETLLDILGVERKK